MKKMVNHPNRSKNLSERVHSSERIDGKRANYHVYTRSNGKVTFNPSWADDPQAAIDQISGLIREVSPRSKFDVVRVVSLTPCFPETV